MGSLYDQLWRTLVCCVLFLALLGGKGITQVAAIDSLKLVLETQPRDTHRVTLLNTLSKALGSNEYKQSLARCEEAIAIADSLDFKPGLASAKAGYAELQQNLGAYAQSMESGLQALDLFIALQDTLGTARALTNVGLVQTALHQYEKAIATLRRAAAVNLSVGNQRGQIVNLHNCAVAYFQKGDTASAKALYLANLKALNGTTHWGIFAATYNNLGNTFPPATQGDSALIYYALALDYKYKSSIPSKSSIGNTLMNIANVYLAQEKLALAEQYMLEAKPLVEESHESIRLLEMHANFGNLYYAQKRYKESAEHYQRQTELQDSIYEPEMTDLAARLEATYQSENQQKEIALLNKTKSLDDYEKAQWRTIAWGIAIGLGLALALLLVLIWRGIERSRMLKLIQSNGEEIKRQQQAILLQNEALSIQNKRLADLNHEKDGLIGIVAHDIRAPLNRSAALAALVESLGNLSPDQERYLKMIQKVSDDGGRLIQDLLELNSYEQNAHPAELTRVDLKMVVEQTMHGFANDALQKEISLQLEAQPSTAKTDEKLLVRILDNLVSNAVKFTPKGKNVYLSLQSDAAYHWIVIRDEGPGINAADQQKMFQKFQRLSARPTGGESSTGLGLSIVRSLADRIGAELRFESTLGKGTTFWVGVRKVD